MEQSSLRFKRFSKARLIGHGYANRSCVLCQALTSIQQALGGNPLFLDRLRWNEASAIKQVAGYLRPTQNGNSNAGPPLHTALMSAELSHEEAQIVSRFVDFLRKERETN